MPPRKRSTSTSTQVSESSTEVEGSAPLDESVPSATDPADETAAAIAARRRAAIAPADQAPPAGPAPAAVGGRPPISVVASRTLVSQIAGHGPMRPAGGVWADRPLVIEVAPIGFNGVTPTDPEYVVAQCDAEESVVPPGCRTPTSRVLWQRGMQVRRDLYDAVLAEHERKAAQGRATAADPARLPEGRDAVPPQVVASGPQGAVHVTNAPPTVVELPADDPTDAAAPAPE